MNNITKELPKLIAAGIITEDTATKIRQYYQDGEAKTGNHIFIVFGILGALLVGLGIVLILAHNWDDLTRTIKVGIAFTPLLLGQILALFVLVKRRHHIAWKESVTTFLFIAIGSCIALISQIYHIPGNLSSFLLTWALLGLPLVYLLQSSMASLLYILVITYYACDAGYWSFPNAEPYLYWPLLAGVLPHYLLLWRKKGSSNFLLFHHWLVPLSLVTCLGTLAGSAEEWMFVAYFSLFGVFMLAGDSKAFFSGNPADNSYRIIGSLGTLVLLLTLSFDDFWADLRTENFQLSTLIIAPEFFVSVLLSALAGVLLVQQIRKSEYSVNPFGAVFIGFILIFIAGFYFPFSMILINLLMLALGIQKVREGARRIHLGHLNFGLLIIAALIVCRFFDTDISFVLRGVLFVLVGVGFFVANYWMISKRKAQ